MRRGQAGHRGRRFSSGVVGVAAYAALVIGSWWGDLPHLLTLALGLMSPLAFLAYAFDKGAAQAGRWRTPESTLHILSALGGWPGALAAQHWLRHKSAKKSFLAVFWITVAINLCLIGWIASERGTTPLAQW